ncbi:MAG: hypothetical protein K8R53_11420 [Bacteroidales bacterium]|nr:hypothetical protein [Bacteroidales bacterium]
MTKQILYILLILPLTGYTQEKFNSIHMEQSEYYSDLELTKTSQFDSLNEFFKVNKPLKNTHWKKRFLDNIPTGPGANT